MAAGINTFGTNVCPEDCDEGVLLPPISENQNCIGSEAFVEKSQICDLWIRPDEVVASPVGFTTGDMGTYLTAEVDNTNIDNTKIKWLVGKGGLPAPDKTTLNLPKGQTRTTSRTHTLPFEVFGIDDAMYLFLQTLQCGDTGFTFVFATLGGRMFGDVSDAPFFIKPTSIDADLVLGEGDDDTFSGTITITFDSNISPDRISNPFA